jgi:hypothetical protein
MLDLEQYFGEIEVMDDGSDLTDEELVAFLAMNTLDLS